MELIKKNKPVIFFLLRFFLVFGTCSLLYGWWIKSLGNEPDAFSWFLGHNLKWINSGLELSAFPDAPAISVIKGGKTTISLFEGCNGIAVMTLFVAFIIAFRGTVFNTIWFSLAGFAFIHLANIFRLQMLVFLSERNSEWFHFMHKYLFSALIYGAVFILWVIWIKWFSLKNTATSDRLSVSE